jgi:hypothetical protein
VFDESTAVSHTVYLCLGRMAQVRVQRVALLQAFLCLMTCDDTGEVCTGLARSAWGGAEESLTGWPQGSLGITQSISHVSRHLQIFSGPVAEAALAGRFLMGAGFHRPITRLKSAIILRQIGW